MSYLELTLYSLPEKQEEILAYMSELDFDSFLQEDNILKGYIDKEKYNEEKLNSIFKKFPELKENYQFKELEDINWNEEWEKNYEPVIIDDQCYIRADFHQPSGKYDYEIVITPKMSFGTGHHATTQLMVSFLLNTKLTYKKVLDAGCGTGILAILASLKGAEQIYAYDTDEWAARNSEENAKINKCQHIQIHQGTINNLSIPSDFDLVTANINKNILIEEIPHYSERLKNRGILLLSGIYESDIPEIDDLCRKNKLEFIDKKIKDNWVALKFKKGK